MTVTYPPELLPSPCDGEEAEVIMGNTVVWGTDFRSKQRLLDLSQAMAPDECFCKSHPIYANPIHDMELPEGVVFVGYGEYASIFEYRAPDKDSA